jgi:hypothetical protein
MNGLGGGDVNINYNKVFFHCSQFDSSNGVITCIVV